MAKEAYYFSHDSNARQDEKILALRMRHGWEGYGIFWALVEKLREASSYSLKKDYNVISFDLRTDASKIKSIVEDFGLFTFSDDGKSFYSGRMIKNMEHRSEAARKAANARWSKNESPGTQQVNAHAMRTHSERIANGMRNDAIKGKEKKVNKSKDDDEGVQEIQSPPTPAEDHPFLSPAQVHLGSPIDECLRMYFDSQEYQMTRDQVAISKHMSIQILRRWGEVFRKHLISQGQTHKTMGDFAKHFRQWIKFQSGDPVEAEKKLFNIDTPSKNDTSNAQYESWQKAVDKFQKRLSGTARQGSAE